MGCLQAENYQNFIKTNWSTADCRWSRKSVFYPTVLLDSAKNFSFVVQTVLLPPHIFLPFNSSPMLTNTEVEIANLDILGRSNM